MTNQPLDIGHGHTLTYACWAPDRNLNPDVAHLPDVARYCGIIDHPDPATGQPCQGTVTFAGQVQREIEPNRPTWTVESWEPLTIAPSVLCQGCGDHGWIRGGQWVPA